MPGYGMLQDINLEVIGGERRKVTEKLIIESEWDRDGMLKSGMEESAPETMESLAKLVEKE